MTKKNLLALTVVLLCGAAGAHAQTGGVVRPAYSYPAVPSGSGPAAVRVADTALFVTPYIGLAVGRDDNLFLSSTNEKASTVYIVSPGFKVDARSANAVFQGSYSGQLGRYVDSEEDNYIDYTVHNQFDIAFDRRNFLKLGWDYFRGHDPRGSTDRGFSSSPDKYRQTNPYATYVFGAPGAAGRVEAYYGETDRRYLNNRETTEASDRKTAEFGGAFYWRVMPKTYLMAEARRTDISYRQPGSLNSAEERRYYGGVSWDATAATTGTIKIGRLERRFDNGDIPAFSDNSWEAMVSWSPRTYSKLDFYTGRQTNESTGLGNFILSDVYGVIWNHAWSSVLSTAVDLRYQKDDYQGFDRQDDIKSIGFKVGYRFRRWLTIGAEYTHFQRDSNLPGFEYDRNLYLLTATASM